MTLTLCNGHEYELPLFDPVVGNHVDAPHSLVQTLIDQINHENIYDRFFKGRKDVVFLDIGANIGLVSVFASPACKRVVAIEPTPSTFQVLKSITLPFKNIEPWEAALAPQVGQVDLYVNEDINSTANSTVNTYGTKIAVTGFTLDKILDIAQLEHVDFCKVDCEGCEGESLSLDQLRIASDFIDSYYIETHNCPKTTWQDKMATIVGRLTICGYKNITTEGMAIIAYK